MATKSFLTEAEARFALSEFAPPGTVGGEGQRTLGQDFSRWLGERLEERFRAEPDWQVAHPVALGSWARGELCPKSDIDMIFCGPEDVVQSFVGRIQAKGLRLRARVPEDHHDWTIGVEAFDILAILNGRAFDPMTEEKLKHQQERIRARGGKLARDLLRAIEKEKESRRLRFDSVANYLEPNIKYGPGGLRDIEQALAVRSLFRGRFEDTDASVNVFNQYKRRWLALRQWLHLNGGGDLISGMEQPLIAKAFGDTPWQDFMRDFQRGISEVNFYANLTIAQARGVKSKRKTSPPQSQEEALRLLEKGPDVIHQALVRERLKELKGSADWAAHFKVTHKEEFFEALFESRLMDTWLKDVTRLRGLVQHDHYHRFTADAHLLQAIKETVRDHRRPSRLGKLEPRARRQDAKSWQILLWTALFHDLAKGLGGDHSTKGAHLVERELAKTSVSREIVEEVKWMVENHLTLSTAAFRMNVQDPKTWLLLHSKGALGARLERLALFTAIDIRATNPDAWNEWKSRLLADLLAAMESAGAKGFVHLLSGVGRKEAQSLALEIDPAVAQSIPPAKLLADIKKARRAKKDLPPLALRNRRREMWVRFHSHEDKKGLFLRYVGKLFALGCSIQQSAVRTVPQIGVYDWFQVKTQKTPSQILRGLEIIREVGELHLPSVKLQRIEVISQTEEETILSFRGRDQKGILLNTAQALFELGYTIRWAKVTTWGSQIDDVFAVSGGPDMNVALEELCRRFHVVLPDSAEVEKSSPASV